MLVIESHCIMYSIGRTIGTSVSKSEFPIPLKIWLKRWDENLPKVINWHGLSGPPESSGNWPSVFRATVIGEIANQLSGPVKFRSGGIR
jgi:hypothetical protein